MAALDPNVLLEESKCYACFDPNSVAGLSKLALLSRISQGSHETAFVTSWTPGASRNDFSGSVGGVIIIGASNVVVSQLGVYIVAGGTNVHTMSLWTMGCALITSALIDFTGKSGANYTAITPVTLIAGTSYRISLSVVIGQDLWTNNVASVMTTTSVGVANNPCFGLGVPCPSTNGAAGPPYVGMDFKYTSP